MFRSILRFFSALGRPKHKYATSWFSTIAAASEEWGDSTKFTFLPTIPEGCDIEDLVRRIVDEARREPDQDKLLALLSTEFGLPGREPIRAVDRALGGIVRTAAKNPTARPSNETDPIAAISFDIASSDEGVIDDIFPGWREWPPGPHSNPQDQVGEDEEVEQNH